MNDRHPTGTATPPDAVHASAASYDQHAPYDGYSGYDGYAYPAEGYAGAAEGYPAEGYAYDRSSGYGYPAGGGYDTTAQNGGYAADSFEADPLFGTLNSEQDTYGTTGQWGVVGTPPGGTPAYDPYAQQQPQQSYGMSAQAGGDHPPGTYDNGYGEGYAQTATWEAAAWTPEQPPAHTGGWDAGAYGTGSYETGPAQGYGQDHYAADGRGGQHDALGHDTRAARHPAATGTFEPGAFTTQTFETMETATFEAPSYDERAHETPPFEAPAHESADTAAHEFDLHSSETQTFAAADAHEHTARRDAYDEAPERGTDGRGEELYGLEDEGIGGQGHDAGVTPVRAVGGRSAPRSRSRRRSPARRSALLTVAVPSVCVMGVAGIAAASVGTFGGDEEKEAAAAVPDTADITQSAVANSKLDSQLANLSANAGDFADRASRTQERIDLKAKQDAERKKAAEEAARKEALRPKFVLPIKQHGLSAYFGQAGVNWMSVHTGIDFPVSYGTEVMAATDGTVRTEWNSAYGNMAILTAPDGTETWYCHLSGYQVRSGTVKAGDVIAFSGNSGNSTGPHMHFEVRPGGGAAIDPLPWLRSHGLDPT